jgi:hypothetical protein
MLSPGDESPFGENRSGTPAGERARKRRAAQAALLRGASRTPLACGHLTPASAGVLLPFIFCRGRVDKRRFVDETASTAPRRLLRGFVVLDPQNSDAKTAPRERTSFSCPPKRGKGTAEGRGRGVSEKAHRDLDAPDHAPHGPLPHFVGEDTNSRRVLFGRHEFGISG